jgi:hypothetical protein
VKTQQSARHQSKQDTDVGMAHGVRGVENTRVQKEIVVTTEDGSGHHTTV